MSISKTRLIILRICYAIIAIGLVLVAWPELLIPNNRLTDPHSVVQSVLCAISVFAILGVVRPIEMLPVLLFELIWKLLWLAFFGLPNALVGSLDSYGEEVFAACLFGVVLVSLSMPWKVLISAIFRATSVVETSKE